MDRFAGLLQRFLAHGDEEAMEELVKGTRPPLLKAARRIAGPDDAEDAVQTAYHSLLRKAAVPEHARLMAWLMTAVVRIAYRHRAKRRKEHELAQRLRLERGRNPENGDREAVRREIDRLPHGFRDVVVLHYLEGLTAAETGRLLDLSETAVRQRLHRARALLRSRLGPRLHHGLFVLLTLGGVMKARAAVTGTLVLLALVAGITTWRATRPDPVRERASATHDATSRADAPPSGADTQAEVVPAAATPKTPFASGVVFDSTMAPVPGVHVVARGLERLGGDPHPAWIIAAKAGARALAVTGDDGSFVVREKPVPELHALAFFKAGYAATQFVVHDERARNQDLRIVLETGRRFEGVVRDGGSNPVAGVKIAAWAAHESGVGQYAYTDDRGRFEFRSLLPQRAMVMAAAIGYGHRIFQPDKQSDFMDITLLRRQLVIETRDADDETPVAATAVLLRDHGRVYVTTSTRPDSIESFVDVPGRLSLAVEHVPALRRAGSLDAEVHVFAPGYRTHVAPVRLEKDKEPPHLKIALLKGDEKPTVAGRVEGPERATLELRAGTPEGFGRSMDDGLPVLFRAETAAAGAFRFPAVPGGRFRLVARAPGFAPLGIDVEPPATELVLRLHPACTLEVRTRPRAGIHVECEAVKGRVWNLEADGDGIARFPDLPPGRVRIAGVKYDAHLSWDMVEPQATAEMSPGRTVRVELPLPDRVAFTIVVRDDSGRPRAGVALLPQARKGHAVSKSGEYSRLRAMGLKTDAAGRATADLYPGIYQVDATDGRTKREFEIVVPAQAGGKHEWVVPAVGGAVRGRVVERGTDKPIRGRPVYAAYADRTRGRGWLGTSVTDAQGRYEITGLPHGALTVYCAARSNPRGGRDRESPYPSAQRAFELAAGGATMVDFALPRVRGAGAKLPVVVALSVRDAATGLPLEGASVSVQCLIEGMWISEGGRAVSGKDGRGEGRVLAAERYKAWVFGPRHKPSEAETRLEAGILQVEAALERR